MPTPMAYNSESVPSKIDVNARLAALKAKLQADKIKIPTESAPQDSPKTTEPSPFSQISTGSEEHLLPITQDVTKLQKLIDSEKAAHMHTQAKMQGLQDQLAAESARAAEELSRERAAASQHIEQLHLTLSALQHKIERIPDLECELRLAREEAAAERADREALEAQLGAVQEDQGSNTEAEMAAAKAECALLRNELSNLRSKELEGSAQEESQQQLQAALHAGEAERASLKQQLAKLKAQMLGEQEDEEDKIRWRVDAEVKLALERMQRSESRSGGNKEEVDILLQRIQVLEADVLKYEGAESAREAEIQNLQKALNELSYESEAAEKLRGQARALQAELLAVRNELDASRIDKLKLEERTHSSEIAAEEIRRKVTELSGIEGKMQGELLKAQAAAAEAAQKLLAIESGSMIDRSTVVKVLASYFEKRQSKEMFQIMSKMLGFTEEDQQLLINSQRQSTVSSKAIGNGHPQQGGGGSSLADSWIDFLVQQVEEDARTPPAQAV